MTRTFFSVSNKSRKNIFGILNLNSQTLHSGKWKLPLEMKHTCPKVLSSMELSSSASLAALAALAELAAFSPGKTLSRKMLANWRQFYKTFFFVNSK
jgi:hypothetical protein